MLYKNDRQTLYFHETSAASSFEKRSTQHNSMNINNQVKAHQGGFIYIFYSNLNVSLLQLCRFERSHKFQNPKKTSFVRKVTRQREATTFFLKRQNSVKTFTQTNFSLPVPQLHNANSLYILINVTIILCSGPYALADATGQS